MSGFLSPEQRIRLLEANIQKLEKEVDDMKEDIRKETLELVIKLDKISELLPTCLLNAHQLINPLLGEPQIFSGSARNTEHKNKSIHYK